MAYVFSDAQNKLSILLQDSNTGADDAWPLTIRKKELNRGELQFAKDSMCVRNKATGTLDATKKITLPTDFLEVVTIIVSNYNLDRDREISIQDYERWYNYAGAYPLYYFSEESGVRYIYFIGSVTGLAYSLYYISRPTTELSGDSDTSLLPEEFREGPVYYAASQLLQQVGKSEYADRYLAIYSRLVRDAQKYAESMYRSKRYAAPDTNYTDLGSTDVQGGGYDYGM